MTSLPRRHFIALACAAAFPGLASAAYTVDDRMADFGTPVLKRLAGHFRRAGVDYPPEDLAYLVFKDTKRLEVYARPAKERAWRFIKRYPILAASGELGPKLREGDNQVPEGLYRIEAFNPNSRFHVSLRLNYPNEFDRRMARADKRTRLGSDIMIHGNAVSIGCVAMGDSAAEELFAMAVLATRDHVQVIISPTDFRQKRRAPLRHDGGWVTDLYEDLRVALRPFPAD
ncbi:MAG: hypothetical protein RLZZ618_4040 [Pseudomonadota bacterium]|jgi:hypothetical protein